MGQSKIKNIDLVEKINAASGGTNIDSSSSTGVPQIISGTWSINSTFSPWSLISSQNASNSTTISFTGLTSSYKSYMVKIINAVSSSASAHSLNMVHGIGATPSYISSGYLYSNFLVQTFMGGSPSQNTYPKISTSSAYIALNGPEGSGGQYNFVSGDIYIPNPSQTTIRHGYYGNISDSFTTSGSDFANLTMMVGYATASTAVTALQFSFDTGNISSGTFELWGIS